MAFPDLFKLEKLQILAFSDRERKRQAGQPFEAMFNPQSLSQSFGSEFAPPRGRNNGTQSASFVRARPASLRLGLLLDGTGVGKMGLVSLLAGVKTVRERVQDFLGIAYAVQGETHEPTYLRLVWGRLLYECRLSGVTVTYTSFDRNGEPLRAELELTLAADADPKK